MTNKPLLAVGLFAVILLVLLSYFFGNNNTEILRAQLKMQQLRSQRDSIKVVVAIRDSMQRVIQGIIKDNQVEADSLKDKVGQLEEERKEAQLSVRKLRKDEDLQNKFIETFPEIAGSDWGVQEVHNEEADLDIEYLLVPLWFSETFIIDHQNSKSYKKQTGLLYTVDSLRINVIALQDSVLRLEEEKSSAYKNGYDIAYGEFEDLNDKYINELKKPTFGLTQWIIIAGAVGTTALVSK